MGHGFHSARRAEQHGSQLKMPWNDWQFWIVTLVALLGACAVVRPMLPSRGKSHACPGCPSASNPAKPRPAKLTIEGMPTPPSRGAGG